MLIGLILERTCGEIGRHTCLWRRLYVGSSPAASASKQSVSYRKLTRADLMLRISSSTTSQGFQIRSSCSLCCVYDGYNDPLHRLFAAHAASMSIRHIIFSFPRRGDVTLARCLMSSLKETVRGLDWQSPERMYPHRVKPWNKDLVIALVTPS